MRVVRAGFDRKRRDWGRRSRGSSGILLERPE